MLFLVDGKLVLLQPSTNDDGDLKYDMRVIAQNVEHYLLARDSPDLSAATKKALELGSDASNEYFPPAEESASDLRDSLWLFDGHNVRSWTDIQSLLESAPAEYGRELPPSTCSPVDFYPLSILLNKGIAFGVESELSQARDLGFSLFRMLARVSIDLAFQGTSTFRVSFRLRLSADAKCRPRCSSQTFSDISSLNMTLLEPSIFLITTKISLTFLTL